MTSATFKMKQLNAYSGIDIMQYQSGDTHYQDRINKCGNKLLRKILYFMVCTILMAGPTPLLLYLLFNKNTYQTL